MQDHRREHRLLGRGRVRRRLARGLDRHGLRARRVYGVPPSSRTRERKTTPHSGMQNASTVGTFFASLRYDERRSFGQHILLDLTLVKARRRQTLAAVRLRRYVHETTCTKRVSGGI